MLARVFKYSKSFVYSMLGFCWSGTALLLSITCSSSSVCCSSSRGSRIGSSNSGIPPFSSFWLRNGWPSISVSGSLSMLYEHEAAQWTTTSIHLPLQLNLLSAFRRPSVVEERREGNHSVMSDSGVNKTQDFTSKLSSQ